MQLTPEALLSASDERSQDLGILATIYPELVLTSPFSASISLPVSPLAPVPVKFGRGGADTAAAALFSIAHLPPLTVEFTLPPGYPATAPPATTLSTTPAWLPRSTIARLQAELHALWEDSGRAQCVYAATDHLQQSADAAFSLVSASRPHLPLPARLKDALTAFNTATHRAVFAAASFTCGICLEPKKGTHCHRLRSCTHVFCLPCLRDYFGAMIAEGSVSSVVCSDPACTHLAATAASDKGALLPPTIPPDELSEIGIPQPQIHRYTSLKLKAALEKDPETVYCPRPWCQSASRESISLLHAAMAHSHASHYLPPLTPHLLPPPPPAPPSRPAPHPKLRICSSCAFAFCRVCTHSWHGDTVICRSPNAPLSMEEEKSEAWLRANTTPCPECETPVVKSQGCNHMVCRCKTHFCFLCSAYLDAAQPYKHFNTKGKECYMKLWEGEEGDGHGRAREEVVEGGEEWNGLGGGDAVVA